MSLNTKIFNIFKTTIELEQLAVKDTESDDETEKVSNDTAKRSKTVGYFAPFIKINGYTFDHHDIEEFTFDESNFLPTINAIIIDKHGIFKSAYFPKTHPILSLYIRSKHDELKCIRCDFLITSIDTDSSSDPDHWPTGKNMTIILSGALFVPMIYDNTPQSYSNLTSLQVLQELASDMKLGFSTNEDYTNDRMTWIKPLIRRNTFIQHVTTYAFKDDHSFYTGFINRHYDMTLVNIGAMFVEDLDFDKAFHNILSVTDIYKRQSDTAIKNEPIDFILTNYTKMSGIQDMYISEYTPNTRQGNILSKYGYIRNIGFYDQQLTPDYAKNFVDLDVKPISLTLKPDGTDLTLNPFASNSNGEWCGIDYNNGHDNFNFAQIQNEHNNMDIRKITLSIKMNGINLNLVRGQRVPVLIVHENREEISFFNAHLMDGDKPKDTEKNEEIEMQKDKWLSGYYVIGSISYKYDSTEEEAFTTEVELFRMNWNEQEAKLPTK